jgi:NitT/TauT family transport system ATP-binding protein
MDPIITLDGVTHRYVATTGSPIPALAGINLRIKTREFVSIVGPSGCGKSTILRLIAGLLQPSEGAVRVLDRRELRGFADVAVVFQNANLLPWRTVIDNIVFPIRMLRRRVTAEDRARAQALLASFGLDNAGPRYPDELSGGMQQRVGICRALILDAEILVMDEPFSALDALTREELQMELLRFHEESKKTVVFVTHSISEAVLLSDRVAVMSPNPGRIIDVVPIDIPHPRTVDTTLDPHFAELVKRVRDGVYARRSQS